jgi:hypothetical protein
MRFFGILSYIVAVAVFIFLILLPTIFTWIAIFNNTVGGIVFSLFLFWFAILAYPIALLIAGLATGIGGTGSVIAAVMGYALMGVDVGLWFLGAWLNNKADESKQQKEWIRSQMASNNVSTKTITDQTEILPKPSNKFIGNTKTKILHCIDCPQVTQMADNYELFNSPVDANIRGYKPCKMCKPELYVYRESLNKGAL